MSDQILNIEALVELVLNRIEPVIEAKLRAVKPDPGPAQPEVLSRKQAADLLKVSLVTIGEWTKQGLITGYRKGRRVYYKKSELESSLNKIRTL